MKHPCYFGLCLWLMIDDDVAWGNTPMLLWSCSELVSVSFGFVRQLVGLGLN